MEEIEFRLSPRRVLVALLAITSGFVILSVVGNFSTHVLGRGNLYGLIPLFDLNREGNAPTWFSSTILLFAALLLMVISGVRNRVKSADTLYWRLLSLGFFCMSMDEACSIHELFTEPLRDGLGLDGVLYYAWVIPGIALTLMSAAVFSKFLLRLPQATRNLFLVAASAFVGGAIGVELVGSYVDWSGARDTHLYRTLVTIEETLEMTGVSIFIFALMRYLRDDCRTALVR